MFGGVNQIGQYNVVVLDRGARDGLEPGTVLRVDQRGETDSRRRHARLARHGHLPDEEAGLLMVFRSFDRVSFGLVMHASRVMHTVI